MLGKPASHMTRLLCGLVTSVLQLAVAADAKAYTALAASPDELRKTLVVVKNLATQADADAEAIRHCKTVSNSLDVGYAADGCRVVYRQIVAGHGAVACDDRLCAVGNGAESAAAGSDAMERCRKASKAAARCAPIASMVWRDDKVSSQAELDAAEAAKTSTAAVSNDRASLFGLVAGRTTFASIPSCAGETLRKGQPYCYNAHKSAIADPDVELLRSLQLRGYDVVINAQMFDVSTLYSNPLFGTFAWAYVWVSKDGVIRRVRLMTSLVEAGTIRSNLVQKFGQPTNEGLLDWIDNRNGQVTQQTPRLTWDNRDYRVFFDARAPLALDNPQGDRGSLEMYDMGLLRQVWEFERKKKPQQRGM